MPLSVDFVDQILEKLTLLDTARRWVLQALWKAKMCMFLQGGWIGAYEG